MAHDQVRQNRNQTGWPDWLAVLVAAGLAAVITGLNRGEAYARYIAITGLAQRRPPLLDGYIDGVRTAAAATLEGVAYIGGHYVQAEPPLTVWLGLLLHGIGNLLAIARPEPFWPAAMTSAVDPLLLLGLLLGVAALGRELRLSRIGQGLLVALIGLLVVVHVLIDRHPWLAVIAVTPWLIIGWSWPRQRGALGHGLLAGLLMASHPLLAPAAGLALGMAPRHRLARLAGVGAMVIPFGLWQFLLFGRPWRFASFFLVDNEPEPEVPMVALGFLLVSAAAVIVASNTGWYRPTVLAGALALPAFIPGAADKANLLLLPLLIIGLASLMPGVRWQQPRWRPVLMTLVGLSLLPLGVIVARQLHAAWSDDLLTVPMFAYSLVQRLMLVAMLVVAGLWVVVGQWWWRVGGLAVTLMMCGSGLVIDSAAPSVPEPPSLVAPFRVEAPSGGLIALWRLEGGARLDGTRLSLTGSEAAASSPLLLVRAGERYCAALRPAQGTLLFAWEDDAHRTVAQHGGSAAAGRLCFAAPLLATGLRLRVSGGAEPLLLEQAELWADSVRVAPLPDYATAALAFTFDWESTMGGLIHSKGGTAALDGSTTAEGEGVGPGRDEGSRGLLIAIERGRRMRRGAEILDQMFRPHGIRGTFYSTGYNLLTGNREGRRFAGDPTYRFASTANRWTSNYWTSHRWYEDDPYGTEATHPEWYFGSLTRRLARAGHEIESHTFGHLYVRGISPQELSADLAEWNAAASALGLPPARSFAFPWQSSNSLRAPHFRSLMQAGMTSLTRVYQVRRGHEFELDEVEEMPGLLIYPDFKLDSTPAAGLVARRKIDEVMARRGFFSLWTHPEEVVDAPQSAIWQEVTDYAAAARSRGLWIAPLVEIVERVRATREVEVIVLPDGATTHLRIGHSGSGDLHGLTVELDQAGGLTHLGQPWTDRDGLRLHLPTLSTGQWMEFVVGPGQ